MFSCFCFGITSTLLASNRTKIWSSDRVMEVTRKTIWKRYLSAPTKPLAKNSNISLSETVYQHKEKRKKCKKTTQTAMIQWQCLMDKPHRKPWQKSKTGDISKQSPSPLHHTFLLGRARFTVQPLRHKGFCSRRMLQAHFACVSTHEGAFSSSLNLSRELAPKHLTC